VFPPEDCACGNFTQMYDRAWGWSDARCIDSMPYVCEIPPAAAPPPSPAPPAIIMGYQSSSASTMTASARYTYNTSRMDFYSAQGACVRQGGNLVVYEVRLRARTRRAAAAAALWLRQLAAPAAARSRRSSRRPDAAAAPAAAACPAPRSRKASRPRWRRRSSRAWPPPTCASTGSATACTPGARRRRPLLSPPGPLPRCGAQRVLGGPAAALPPPAAPADERPRPAPSPRRWPTFVPIVATNYTISYTHWGTLQPQGIREPNAFSGFELCAGANGSQFYGGAWGWSDENCGLKAPFVCKIRGWRRCAAGRALQRAGVASCSRTAASTWHAAGAAR
jgi:hypothetical protein